MKKKKYMDNPQEYIQLLEQRIEEYAAKNMLLENENAVFKNILNDFEEGIFIKNENQQYVYVNKAFNQILGKQEEQILIHKDEDLFDSNIAEALAHTVKFEGQKTKKVRTNFKINSIEKELEWYWKSNPEKLNENYSIIGRVKEIKNESFNTEIIESFIDASDAALAVDNFNDAARILHGYAKNTIGAKSGYIALLSPDGAENEVVFLDAGGLPCTVNPELPMPIRGLRAEAYKNQKPAYCNNFEESEWKQFIPKGHAKLENVLFAPINSNNTTVGLLGLANKPGGFNDYDAKLAQYFANLAASVLINVTTLNKFQQQFRQYLTLVENIPGIVYRCNKKHPRTTIFINSEVTFITGYEIQDFISGKVNWMTIIHPDDAKEVENKINAAITSGIHFEMVYRIIHKNGDIRWMHDKGRLVEGNNAQEACIDGVIIDVSKLYETQYKFEIAEKRYQSFFENTGTAMAVFNDDSIISSCNQRFLDLCECNKEDLIGQMHWYDFVHEQDKDRMMGYHQQRQSQINAAPTQYHFRFITKKGNIHEIFLNIVVLSETGERLASLTNVSEVIKLQKELKKQLHFSETLIKTIPVPVFFKDINGKYLGCNKAFEDIMGVSSNEIIGKTVYDLTPSDIAYLYAQKDNELFLNPGYQKYEWVLRNKKGEIREIVYYKASFFDENDENAGIIGTLLDVTERNKNIEQLKQSEERFRLFYEQSPIAYQSLDSEGCFLDVNEVWLKILDYQREQVIGKCFSDFLSRKYKNLFKERFEQFKKIGEVSSVDFEMVKSDGTLIYVLFYGKISYDAHREMIRSHCVFYDLSERHKAEILLKKSEQQLQTIFDATPSVMCLLNDKLEIIRINNTGLQFARNTKDEILNKQGGDVFGCIYALKNPDGCGRGEECKSCVVRNTILKAINEQTAISRVEASMLINRGMVKQQYFILLSVNILNFAGWKGILVTFDDITKRKQMEIALQQSEQHYQKITETITDYIYNVKIENNIAVSTTHSPTCYGVTGYSRQEFINNPHLWYNIIFEDDKVLVEQQLHKLFAFKTSVTVEHRIHKKNGDLRWIANTVIPNIDKHGILISYDGIIRDITERKLAEMQLLDSHNYINSIFKAAPIAIGVVKERVFFKVNAQMCQMLGYTENELLGQSAMIIYPSEDDFNSVGIEKYRQIKEKGTGTVEARWKCKDGSIIVVILSSTLIDNNDWSKGVTFTAVDITKRKLAEQALRKSEEKFRNIIETMNEGLLMVDNNDVILFANTRLCNMFGFQQEELLGKRGLEIIIYEKDRHIIIERNKKRLEKISDSYHIRGITKSGNIIWLSISGSPVTDDTGAVIGSIGLITDITDAKLAEIALIKSEQRYRTIVDTANEGIWTMDEQFVTSYVNNKMASILGYEVHEMLGKKINQFMLHDECNDNEKKIENRQKGVNEIYERTFVRKDGSLCNCIVSANPLMDEAGSFCGSFAMLTDISELRHIEKELLEKNQQIEAFFNYSLDLLCIANIEGYFIRLNPEWKKTLGYSLQDLEGHRFFDFVHPDDLQTTMDVVKDLENQKLILSFINRYRCKDGSYRWIEWRSKSVGTTIYAAARDITQQLQLQNDLMESEAKIRNKLQALLAPDGDISELELSDIVDVKALQKIMDNFYALTNIGIGIIDLNGKVLVATGWQDLCTKFHRVHPDTCHNCIESDLLLSSGIAEGTYKIYKCKNNIWDMAVPLNIAGKHVGNIFLGQFLFEDEQIDIELFRTQAKKYGFNETKYIEALTKLPRWSKEIIDNAMQFYSNFANVVSTLSFSNLKLARIVEQLTQTQTALAQSEKLNRELISNMTDGVYQSTPEGKFIMVNDAMVRIFGYNSIDEMLAIDIVKDLYPKPENRSNKYPESYFDELKVYQLKRKDGTLIWVEANGWYIKDESGKIIRHEGVLRDVTERVKMQEALRNSEENLATTLQSIGDGVIATDKSGYIVNMNLVAEMLCGWTLSDAKGKFITDVFCIINVKTFEPADNPVKKVIETGKVIGLANHTVLISKNGKQYQIADSASPIRNRSGEITGVVMVFSDVTEKYEIAEKLRASEERLSLAMAVKNEGVWDWNLITNETYFDDRYYTMAGYEPDEFPQNFDAWAALVHPDDLLMVQNAINDYFSEKTEIFDIEFRFRHKDNSWIWIRGRGKIVSRNDSGEPTRVVGTHTDITIQKISQIALIESEERFRKLYQDASDPILLMRDKIFIDCNNTTLQYLAADTKEQIIGLTPVDISPDMQFDGRTSEEAATGFINNAITAGFARFEWECKKFNNSPILLEVTLMPIIIKGEKLIHITWRDIGEKKAAEKKIKESEERFRSLVNSLSDVIFTLDTQQRHTGVYGAWVEKAGLTPEFFLGKSASELYDKEFAEIHVQANNRALNGEVVTYEWSIADAQATSYYQTIIAPMYDTDGVIYGLVGAGRNITDRVILENKLKTEKERLAGILEGTNAGTWEWNIQTGETIFNDRWAEIIGYTLDELAPVTIDTWVKYCHPDDLKTSNSLIEKHIKGELDYYSWELRVGHKNGHWVWVLNRGKIISRTDDGKPLLMMGTYLDITERKQAENKLRESEEKHRRLFETMSAGVVYQDADGKIISANPAAEKILHITLDQMMGKTSMYPAWKMVLEDGSLVPDSEHPAMIALRTGKKVGPVIRGIYVPENDHYVWISINAIPLFNDGKDKPSQVYATFDDITDSKRTEKALRKSEGMFKKVFEILPVGLWIADKNGTLLQGNMAGVKIWGIEPKVSQGKYGVFKARRLPSGEEIAPEDWALAHTVNKGVTILNELLEIEAFDGKKKIILNSTAPLLDSNGVVEGAIVVNQDITERQLAEEALRESEERFKSLHNASFGGIAIHDKGIILECNQGLADMTGYTVAELTGGMDGLLLIAEKSRKDVMSKIQSGYEKPYEAFGLRKNGTEYPMRLEARNVYYKGKLVRTVEFRDITEIKMAEQRAMERQLFVERIAEQSPNFIYVFDFHAKTNIFVNKDLRAYLGYQPNQAPDDSYQLIEAVIHPDDVEQFKDYGALVDKWDLEYVKSFEYRLKDAAGNWRYFIGKEKEFQRINGKIVSLIGVVSDVTEQKKSELVIKISEYKYRMLFENMLNGFVLLQLLYNENGMPCDLLLTEANAAFEKMTGIPAKKVVGKKISELPQFVQKDTELKEFYAIAQKGGNKKITLRLDDWNKVFEIFAFGPEIGKLALVVADVTDREKQIYEIVSLNEELLSVNEEFHAQNEELQQTNVQLDEQQDKLQQVFEEIKISEEQYRTLFENMLNGFALYEIILNKKGKPVDYSFLQVNPAFEKLTGLKSSDILYRTVKEVMPEIEDYWIDTYGKVALTGKHIRYENYSKELNRYYEVVAYCPKKMQFAVIISDITERKQLELVEETRKEEIQQLALLAEQLIKVQDLDKFYNLIGKTIQNIIGKGYIVITQYQPDEDNMCIKKFYGIGKKLETLAKILGINPIGFTIPLSDSVRYLLHNYHAHFYKYEGGIRELFHGVINESLAAPVTKAFDIKDVYGISLMQKNFILGSITIFTTSANNSLKLELLESLILQASNAMQRIIYGEDIKEKEQQFRSIFNNSEDAIFILDSEGYVIEANNIACSRLEYPKTELLGLNREQFNHPDYKIVFLEAIKRVKKHTLASYETIHITKSGKNIPVEAFVNTIDYKGKKCFMVVARDITERKEIEKRIFNAVIEAEEKERLRFSKDLHDGIGALLSSIKIYINLLETAAEEHKRQLLIESTKELIGEAILAAREISRNLQPSTIRDFGLVSSVQTFIDKINKTGVLKINSRYMHLEARLPINAEVMLYRIITELFNNTLKHANAKGVTLLLSKENNLINLLYVDDGIGFDAEKVKHGLGLDNIRARVLSIEGVFKMETEKGMGIKVSIIIDLRRFNTK